MIASTNKLIIIFFLTLIITTLHSDTINQLSNKNLTISGYFFASSKSSYFLRYINENNSSLWLYTKQRKFKPVHNAGAYDGYDKAGMLFKSIIVDTNHSINISSIINNDSPYNDISNKTFIPTHLLLKDKDTTNYSVLANKNATSLWEYTNRKFKPIHNARAFDGYEEAKKIFDDISITEDNIIHIGDIDTVNYASFKTKEYSLNNTRAIKIIKTSDYKDNFMQLTDNLIMDKANELIWQNNNDDTLRTYKEAKAYCENLEIHGYRGFRLPSGLEGISLFDDSITMEQLNFLKIKLWKPYWTNYSMHKIKDTKEEYNAHKFYIKENENNNTLHFMFTAYWNKSIPDARTICVKGDGLIKPILIRNNTKNIVLDVTNNLMWQDDINLRKNTTINKINNYCSSNTLGGFKDWRHPTSKEFFIVSYDEKRVYKIPIFDNLTFVYTTYIDKSFSDATQEDITQGTYNIWDNIGNTDIYEEDNIYDKDKRAVILDYYSQKTKKEILSINSLEIEKERKEEIDNLNKEISKLKDAKPITKNNYKQILTKENMGQLASPPDPKTGAIVMVDSGWSYAVTSKYYISKSILKQLESEKYDVSSIATEDEIEESINLLNKKMLFYQSNKYNFNEIFLINKLIGTRRAPFIIEDNSRKYFYHNKQSIDKYITYTTISASSMCVRKQ